jgi:hypothetical protein
MTTTTYYKSEMAHAYLRVRWGRKHGMPRGRGHKAWRLLNRIDFNPEHVTVTKRRDRHA